MPRVFLLPLLPLLALSAVAATEEVLPPVPPLDRVAAQEVRAQIVPVRSAVLSSGMAGRIAELPVREGERFSGRDVLLSFDCAINRARLARAAAVVDESEKTW